MTSDEILLDVEERMEKAINILKHSLAGIRTGRANPGLVDSLRVEAYGSQVPMKQLASVAPRSRTRSSSALTIQGRSRTSKRRFRRAIWASIRRATAASFASTCRRFRPTSAARWSPASKT